MTIAEQMRAALSSRFKPDWGTEFPHLKSTFDTAVLLIGAPDYQLGEIKKNANGNLSEKGIREAYRTKLGSADIVGRLKRDAAAVKRSREEIALKRASVGNSVYDKTDVVAAMHRQEMRQMIRAMRLPEQLAKLRDDKLFAEAVFERPASVSNIPEAEYVRFKDMFVRTHFAAQIAELDDQADVLDHIDTAIETAFTAIKAESGLTGHDAQRWIDSVAA